MNLVRLLLLAALSLGLSGCATRGALKISCRDFDKHVTRLDASDLLREIQGDADGKTSLALDAKPLPPKVNSLLSPLGERIRTLSLPSITAGQEVRAEQRTPNVLLLSGGGQWGAFGAGFLKARQAPGLPTRVDYDVITGVSTGGLQALFVAIDREDSEAYTALAREYAPAKESDLVDRGATPMALITGSFAGLNPLRATIEKALCTGGDPAAGCPMIEKLARANRTVLVGFVNATTGDFEYADVVALASAGADRGVEELRNAQQCLTGVTLASAAMPVFFQQVKINNQVYYDGGVRLSVFEGKIARDVEEGYAAARAKSLTPPFASIGKALAPTPNLYVMRNGPTHLLGPDGKPGPNPVANERGDAITAAERSESILVNQLEVGSIASLRLARPSGPILLMTADGYEAWPGKTDPGVAAGECKKGKGMFDPKFMECLQRYGAFMALNHKWRPLPDLPTIAATRDSEAAARAVLE